MNPEEKQRIFEMIELPMLIKNLNVPSMEIIYADGEKAEDEKKAFYFKREAEGTILYKCTVDILQKHNMADEILTFLFDEAKTDVYLADDIGIAFRIKDSTDKEGNRRFVWLKYHKFAKALNAELRDAFKQIPQISDVCGLVDADKYVLISPLNLAEYDDVRNIIVPVIQKHLPEGVSAIFARVNEGASVYAVCDELEREWEKLA
jgi:hypothetical protein